jgi:A/G-specific adenine glycosylase
LANSLLDTNHPGTFNQAVMELGALVCTPQRAACNSCPLSFTCEALKRLQVENFPVKTPKKAPTVRHFNYLVISFKHDNEEFILMRKRTANDIWKNMYDFPCIESAGNLQLDEVIGNAIRENLFSGLPFTVKHISCEYIHQLSHRRLLARFLSIELKGAANPTANLIAVRKDKISELPIPRLIDRYVANLL